MSDLKPYLGQLPIELRRQLEADADDDERPVDTVRDSTGTTLTLGAIPDGAILQRSGTTLVGSQLVASWPIASVGYFALDPDGGSDAAGGFSAVSMAAAGAVAKATWAGILAGLPSVGLGRDVVIAIKPRAAGATINETMTIKGRVGFNAFHVVATSDFSDTAADRIISGAVQAQAGPGGDGAWTVDVGATTSVISISSGSLSVEPALVQYRVRFDSATTTVALRNITACIKSNTTTQITLGDFLPAVPASGDVFFVEKQGVVFTAVDDVVQNNRAYRGIASAQNSGTAFSVVGSPGANLVLTWCAQRGASAFVGISGFVSGDVSFTRTYTPVSGSSARCGGGFRAEGSTFLSRIKRLFADCSGLVSTGKTMQLSAVDLGGFGEGCTFLSSINLSGNCGLPHTLALANTNTDSGLVVGTRTTASFTSMRLEGSITFLESHGVFQNTVVANASDVICLNGNGLRVRIKNVTGSSGNTGFGITSAGANQKLSNSIILIDSTTTVTGTSGDILLGDDSKGSYADLAVTNILDPTGNDWQMLTRPICRVTGRTVTNKTGSALSVGQVVRSNATTGEVVAAQADTAAHARAVLGVMLTSPANNATGVMASGGHLAVRMDAAPTAGGMTYLDEGSAGVGTTTVPPGAATNQKLRLGWVQEVLSIAAVNYALVPWQPELVSATSDGVAD